MKDVSHTGILFLIYNSSPTSLISTFSEQILVLGNTGSVLFSGSLDEGKELLYDTYFEPQKHYNSVDCIYHVVCSVISS